MKERRRLDNTYELHPDNGSWRNFLKDTTLKEEKNGFKHYVSGNGHYIVTPDEEVIVFHGYHGNVAFDAITTNPKEWFAEREKVEKEWDDLQKKIQNIGSVTDKLSISNAENKAIHAWYDNEERKSKPKKHKTVKRVKSSSSSPSVRSIRK